MKIFWTKERQWQVDVTIAGRRIREHGFAKKKDAEVFVAELKVQAKRGRFGLDRDRARVLVSELVEEHGADIDQSSAGGRQKKRVLESFLASLPAGLSLDELSTAHFREWLKELKRKGLGRGPCSNHSCNRYLSDISVMLTAAPKIFLELGEDWVPPRIPWQKQSTRGRERIIAPEESALLLEHLRFPRARKDGGRLSARNTVARRDVADCFELALLTGMRGGEVRQLEWADVFLDQQEIHLPAHKTKTRTARVVLLNRRALEILQRRKNYKYTYGKKSQNVSQMCPRWLFPNEAGTGPRKEISRVIRPVARSLGLRYGRDSMDGFTPHSTRHTATTSMLRAGFDLKTVADVVGHSDKVMSLRYAHSSRETRLLAVESLARSSVTRQKVDKEKD